MPFLSAKVAKILKGKTKRHPPFILPAAILSQKARALSVKTRRNENKNYWHQIF
jgi:hypothetical protein